MEEYLKTLLEQIRCKKAHASIYHEIKNHIEEQMEENEAQGMNKEDALKETLQDMGDPVQIGVEMDQIHRPQIAWKLILGVGILTLFSIVVQYLITKKLPQGDTVDLFQHHIFNAILSFLAMIAIYRIDYSLIGKYVKWIATAFLLFTAFQIFVINYRINGMLFMRVFSQPFTISPFFFLYVPIFGAILYQYHGKNWRALPKIFIWMALPLFLTLQLPNLGLTVSLFFMLAGLLTIAIWKEWFAIPKKKFLTAFWGISFLSPIALAIILIQSGNLAAYQIERIRTLFDRTSGNNVQQTLHNTIQNCTFIGESGNKSLFLEGGNSSYPLSILAAYYGIFITLVVLLLLFLFIRKIFQISSSQKNQLGMMMGYGCGMVFCVSAVWNTIITTGLIPPTYTFLPIFSYGGTTMLASYILLGIVLSIYRYKNILSDTYQYKKNWDIA